MTTTDETPEQVSALAEPMTRPLKNTWSSVQAVEASFADFDVRPEIVQALADAGITHPFPIQAMTLPVALSGHDIIGQAKTGTGKTLGFGVPLLHRVVAPGEEGYEQLAHARQAAGARRRPHPRARRAGGRRPRHAPARAARSACCRSTAAARTSRRSTR